MFFLRLKVVNVQEQESLGDPSGPKIPDNGSLGKLNENPLHLSMGIRAYFHKQSMSYTRDTKQG